MSHLPPRVAALEAQYPGSVGKLIEFSIRQVAKAGATRDPLRIAEEQARHADLMATIRAMLGRP